MMRRCIPPIRRWGMGSNESPEGVHETGVWPREQSGSPIVAAEGGAGRATRRKTWSRIESLVSVPFRGGTLELPSGRPNRKGCYEGAGKGIPGAETKANNSANARPEMSAKSTTTPPAQTRLQDRARLYQSELTGRAAAGFRTLHPFPGKTRRKRLVLQLQCAPSPEV